MEGANGKCKCLVFRFLPEYAVQSTWKEVAVNQEGALAISGRSDHEVVDG